MPITGISGILTFNIGPNTGLAAALDTRISIPPNLETVCNIKDFSSHHGPTENTVLLPINAPTRFFCGKKRPNSTVTGFRSVKFGV